MASEAVNDLDALPDADLVARIAAGDESAFSVAYDRHVGIVYGAAVRYLQSPDLAEEVAQDVFVGLWRYAATFDARTGSLVGWLLGIARNKSIDRRRSILRRPVEAAPGPLGRDDDLDRAFRRRAGSHDADDPDEHVIQIWRQAVVRSALSVMPEVERRTLELAYDEGLSQSEIAQRMGWPIGTVKTRTRRALANMRLALEKVPDLAESHSAMGGRDGTR